MRTLKSFLSILALLLMTVSGGAAQGLIGGSIECVEGPNLLQPSGVITTNHPTYTWRINPNLVWWQPTALSFLLTVEDSTGTVIQEWYPNVNICHSISDALTAGLCSVTPGGPPSRPG